MRKIQPHVLAGIEFKLKWQSALGVHEDCYFGPKVNFWRDFMPMALQDALMNKVMGDEVEVPLPLEDIIPAYSTEPIFDLPNTQFNQNFVRGRTIKPRFGRFYPSKFLQNVSGNLRAKTTPFRCIAQDDNQLRLDFNHPLAQQKLNLAAKIHDIRDKHEERGGRCHDWPSLVTQQGVGFQIRYQNQPTDFFSDAPFSRLNETDDSAFYQQPRLVTHIDDKAIEILEHLYRSWLTPGMKILDLMSSWKSHLPTEFTFDQVLGLGMNVEELKANSQLTDFIVHDLNQEPQIPLAENTFDAVICTVSVEYLTQPIEVFKSVAQLLKVGGFFMVTFSNRWFPPKVINIWPDIHEFERMGLVMEYFLQSGQFEPLKTYSIRNFPRPENDKYRHESLQSDPIFAVCGQKM